MLYFTDHPMKPREPLESDPSAAAGTLRLDCRLDPKVVLRWFLAGIAVLFVLGLLSAYLVQRFDRPPVLLRLFLMNHERNVPTLFSFVLFVISAALLAAVAARPAPHSRLYRAHWIVLAALFVLMAFDEAASVHEALIPSIRERLGATGPFYFAWVVPGWIFVCVVLVAYLPFLRSLPKRGAQLLLLAGGVFVAGALGMEMLGGMTAERTGHDSRVFHLLATVEETLEMVGLAIFVYALLRLLLSRGPWHGRRWI